MPVTEFLNSTQCRTCPPLFSLTSCAPTAVGALVLPGLSSGGLVQWPQTHSQTHVMCQPSTAGPTGGLPSLFAGDTPPVYTAPANAILVVGPCLWVLLGDVHMKGGHAQFSKMSSLVLLYVLKLVEYSLVWVHVCTSSVCLFVHIHCVPSLCIVYSLMHTCACGVPSADTV